MSANESPQGTQPTIEHVSWSGFTRAIQERQEREEQEREAMASAHRQAVAAELATPEGRARFARRKAEAENAADIAKQATEAEQRMQRGFVEGTADRIQGLRDSIRAKSSQLALLRDRADDRDRRAAGLGKGN
ncbi:hypothetical protein [Microbacterium panaciterrae]|uniref:Uncharacterized protein n=1 Tax=Microbacterium panaciterrae TaxID=985759 RepID=A0ABP8P9I5_9MICO